MDSKLTAFETELIRHIAALQARCDALEAVVEVIAINHGSTREKYQAVLETARERALQFRLERIEDQNPAAAAKIDDRPLPIVLESGFL
jgi:hypothetical protein